MKRILFVCLGNICRSPLAEGIAQHLIATRHLPYQVDSAGTGSWHEGEAPCTNSQKVARLHGIDISHQRARAVTPKDKEAFDMIVVMDRSNLKTLQDRGFEKLYLLGDFGGYGGADVPDPYYFDGFEGFEKVFAMIEDAMKAFFDQLQKEENYNK